MLNKLESSYFFYIVNSFSFLKLYSAVPYNYCYPRLNKADCNLPPTPVFTYYKPGSRCEIELWRGCPTMNKFANEYECSHNCIGRLVPSFSTENDVEPEHFCQMPMDQSDCTGLKFDAYTFDNTNKTCEKVIWKGCDTVNRFDDKKSCMKACKDFIEEHVNAATAEEKEDEEDDDANDENDFEEKHQDTEEKHSDKVIKEKVDEEKEPEKSEGEPPGEAPSEGEPPKEGEAPAEGDAPKEADAPNKTEEDKGPPEEMDHL